MSENINSVAKIPSQFDCLGPLLGSGNAGAVHAWGDQHVVKLFFEHVDEASIGDEYRNSLVVWRAGLPVPKPFRRIEINGRCGIVYQRVGAGNMQDLLVAKPWRFLMLARQAAKFHAAIHAVRSPGLPPQCAQIDVQIRKSRILTLNQQRELLSLLYRQPDGNQICHGDFQLANILIGSGDLHLVDWCCASQGNPLGDVANTIIGMRFGPLRLIHWPDWSIDVARYLFASHYATRYCRLNQCHPRELTAWLSLIAAARIDSDAAESPQLQNQMLDIIQAGLRAL